MERKRKRWPCDVENGGGVLAARDAERVCVRAHLFMRACGCLKKNYDGN